jgi:hypothetical protein
MTPDEQLEDLDVEPGEAETVTGGAVPRVPDVVKTPPPAGPVPIPYPNVGAKP